MNIFFRKENLKTTIFTIAYLVFGVLFCVIPTQMFNFVESVLCGGLLVVGFVCVIIYALMPADSKIYRLLIYGILSLVFGVLMLLLSKFFGIILSLVIGGSGVSLIIDSIKEKKLGQSSWITDLVVGIVVVVLAVVTMILSGTNVIKNMIAVFFGIMLLIEGIYHLVQLIILAKIFKQAKKEQKEDIVINEFEVKKEPKTAIENTDKKD